MKTFVFVLVAAFALSAPVAAQAAVVPVQSLTPPFVAQNATVVKTADGVHFGTYPDAGRFGGTLEYDGANGQPFSSIIALSYTYEYSTAAVEAPIAAPYLRVLLDATPGACAADQFSADCRHVIFDPTICGSEPVPENVFLTANVSGGPVRVDDDEGANCPATQTTFAAARSALGNLPIGGILITQGFSGGQDANALVTQLTVNGTTFAFNVPPAGAPGTTTIIQVPGPAGAQPGAGVAGIQARGTCRGATVRRIHAPRRQGERFLRVNAALQSPTGLRALRSQGRTITVDLRNRPEANYNVRLISRYRTKGGKTRRVVTRRNLSVACS